MNGVSLHYYTVTGWGGSKGAATKFSDEDYYWTMGKCLEIENVIKKHSAIMDEKDPKKRIGLLVDEWGTWWDEEPGTVRGHLYQQNTMRDAMVAALSLNVFHRHTDRVKMCNIAQVVNVLQSMILTDQKDGGHMVLTPTYHVFRMYVPFQEATYLPIELNSETITVRDNRTVPLVSASAAKTKDGSVVVAFTNVSLDKAQEVSINLAGVNAKNISGQILSCNHIADYNDFDNPEKIAPKPFNKAKLTKKGQLELTVPSKSIIVLNLK